MVLSYSPLSSTNSKPAAIAVKVLPVPAFPIRLTKLIALSKSKSIANACSLFLGDKALKIFTRSPERTFCRGADPLINLASAVFLSLALETNIKNWFGWYASSTKTSSLL